MYSLRALRSGMVCCFLLLCESGETHGLCAPPLPAFFSNYTLAGYKKGFIL